MEYRKIQACLRGNPKAQNELYDLYKVNMFGLCMRYAKNRAEAENFLLEGFHKFFKDLGQFKKGNSLEGWIRRIMMNTALMYIHTKRIVLFVRKWRKKRF
ncbi:MAG: DNA-directed RNA polymerase specialized sigma24 family protein [Maribacter sp.]|jgi:DNA-directed RNA polymerase specialized sigma24 family protein